MMLSVNYILRKGINVSNSQRDEFQISHDIVKNILKYKNERIKSIIFRLQDVQVEKCHNRINLILPH